MEESKKQIVLNANLEKCENENNDYYNRVHNISKVLNLTDSDKPEHLEYQKDEKGLEICKNDNKALEHMATGFENHIKTISSQRSAIRVDSINDSYKDKSTSLKECIDNQVDFLSRIKENNHNKEGIDRDMQKTTSDKYSESDLTQCKTDNEFYARNIEIGQINKTNDKTPSNFFDKVAENLTEIGEKGVEIVSKHTADINKTLGNLVNFDKILSNSTSSSLKESNNKMEIEQQEQQNKLKM